MTQPYRGPIVLTLAGIMLFCAVVAYLLGDLESNARRQEAALVDQELLRDYRLWSIEIHAQLDHQRATITETRSAARRTDPAIGDDARTTRDVEGLSDPQTRLHPSESDRWPMVSGK